MERVANKGIIKKAYTGSSKEREKKERKERDRNYGKIRNKN
jgi:hypothetical protein